MNDSAAAPTTLAAADGRSGWLAAARAWGARRPRAAWWLVWLALVVVLMLWRYEVLTSPPYWDFAMGLFAEADFLVEHDFDYRKLSEQLRFGAGGVATYITSVMPTVVALIMKLSPSVPISLLVCHLIQLGAAAAILIGVYRLLEAPIGSVGAALTALVVLTTPLFAAQVDMLGMDMPLAACFVALVWHLSREQFWRATGWSAAAYAIKTSGTLAAGVVALYLILILPGATRRRGSAWTRNSWLVLAGALALLATEIIINDTVATLYTSRSEQQQTPTWFGAQTLARSVVWCPDLVAAAGATALLTLFVIGRAAWRGLRPPRRLGFGAWLQSPVLSTPSWVLSWLVVLGILSGILYVYAIPRYLLVPVPFLWIAAALALFHVCPWPRIATGVLVAMAAFNLLNEKGRFFPALGEHDRTGAILERSREYLADHQANLNAVQVLETGFADQPIVAGNPFVYFLSLPRLGYLQRSQPLTGYSLNTFSPPPFPDVRRLVRDQPATPVFVWVRNTFSNIGWCPAPEPAKDDVLLWRDSLASPIMIYRKKWSSDEDRQPLAERYRRWLFAGRPELIALTEIETPEQQRAMEALLRQQIADDPRDVDARHNLGVVLARQQKLDEAVEVYQALLAERPTRAVTHCRLADALVAQDRLEDAVAAYEQAIEHDAKLFDAVRGLGATLAQLERYDEAERRLRQACELQPLDENSWTQLGLTQRLAGKLDAARESLFKAPHSPIAVWQLALVEETAGHDAAAMRYYRLALRARPRWPEAQNGLAWLLATTPSDTLRSGKQAVALAQAACQQTGLSNFGMLDTLAAAQAEAGSFAEASRTATKASQLAREAGAEELANEIDARRALYDARQPFRRSPPAPAP